MAFQRYVPRLEMPEEFTEELRVVNQDVLRSLEKKLRHRLPIDQVEQRLREFKNASGTCRLTAVPFYYHSLDEWLESGRDEARDLGVFQAYLSQMDRSPRTVRVAFVLVCQFADDSTVTVKQSMSLYHWSDERLTSLLELITAERSYQLDRLRRRNSEFSLGEIRQSTHVTLLLNPAE